jgi:hypothetical protein
MAQISNPANSGTPLTQPQLLQIAANYDPQGADLLPALIASLNNLLAGKPGTPLPTSPTANAYAAAPHLIGEDYTNLLFLLLNALVGGVPGISLQRNGLGSPVNVVYGNERDTYLDATAGAPHLWAKPDGSGNGVNTGWVLIA